MLCIRSAGRILQEMLKGEAQVCQQQQPAAGSEVRELVLQMTDSDFLQRPTCERILSFQFVQTARALREQTLAPKLTVLLNLLLHVHFLSTDNVQQYKNYLLKLLCVIGPRVISPLLIKYI